MIFELIQTKVAEAVSSSLGHFANDTTIFWRESPDFNAYMPTHRVAISLLNVVSAPPICIFEYNNSGSLEQRQITDRIITIQFNCAADTYHFASSSFALASRISNCFQLDYIHEIFLEAGLGMIRPIGQIVRTDDASENGALRSQCAFDLSFNCSSIDVIDQVIDIVEQIVVSSSVTQEQIITSVVSNQIISGTLVFANTAMASASIDLDNNPAVVVLTETSSSIGDVILGGYTYTANNIVVNAVAEHNGHANYIALYAPEAPQVFDNIQYSWASINCNTIVDLTNHTINFPALAPVTYIYVTHWAGGAAQGIPLITILSNTNSSVTIAMSAPAVGHIHVLAF